MDQSSDVKLEGIAIIGMSGRFPGAAGVAQFWQNLVDGVESISRLTDDQLKAAGIPAETIARPDYVKARAVLDDVDLFDAGFFGIKPRDAELTDPQHRVFLECAWEALEDGGYDPKRTDALIGVFAGSSMNTYLLANLARDRAYIEDFVRAFQVGNYQTLIGNDKDYLATRVSYKLDLRGPSVAVQSACSTSLVAVVQAVNSLLAHQCDLALAGGVSITFPQHRGALFQDGGMSSPDGHCRAFDARSAGTVFGSGAGVVLLKRLEDAVADGDNIYAVIKGAAINNDGAEKASYLAPSSAGQADVIAMAHALGDIDAGTIGYVEAHGTGTPLGDPIEVAGLTRAFRATTDRSGYCVLGSAKTNIGHLEAAAGVAGLIKAAMVVRTGKIPATLGYESPNPEIKFEGTPFYVSGEALDWPNATSGPRRAGVSSFGVGGTNAHVVVEEPPARLEDPHPGLPRNGKGAKDARSEQVLVLSAKTPSALEAASARLATYLAEPSSAAPRMQPPNEFGALENGKTASAVSELNEPAPGKSPSDFSHFRGDAESARPRGARQTGIAAEGIAAVEIADIAYTLQVGRAEFPYRRAITCTTTEDAVARLPGKDGYAAHPAPEGGGQAVFAFPGQGSQHVDMGRALYETEDAFRDAVDKCADILTPILAEDLRKSIYPDLFPGSSRKGGGENPAERLTQTWLTQPALFTIEYALARLWMSWGVQPAAMIGHSIGEFVAATLAGVFTLEDALKVVAARGRLMQSAQPGAMLSVRAPVADIEALVSSGRLAVAAVNSPTACVISGPIAEIEAVEAVLAGRGIGSKRLVTSHAFHSPSMDPILEEFENVVASVELSAPMTPYVSNVTGTWITDEEATDPAYYARHIRSTVLFGDGVALLLSDPGHVLLEVGPGHTLCTLARQSEAFRPESVAVSSLGHAASDVNAATAAAEALGRLWCAGVAIDWTAYHAGERRLRVPLPTYPFERRRCWVDPPPAILPLPPSEAERVLVSSRALPERVGEQILTPTIPEAGRETEGRVEGLIATLTEMTQAMSGIARDQLSPDVSFLDLGLDSLFLTQASQAFGAKFGVEIKFRYLLDQYGTIRALAQFIDSKLPPEPNPLAARGGDPAPSPSQTGNGGDPVRDTATGAGGQEPASTGETALERVIREQLDLMRRQLDMLESARSGSIRPASEISAQPDSPAHLSPFRGDAESARQRGIAGAGMPVKAFGPYRPIEAGERGGLTERQQRALDELVSLYTSRTPGSKRLTTEARPQLADPRVVAGFKSIWKEMVYPIVADRSAGSKIWDVDGNEYVDVAMGFGLNLLGHSPQLVTEAVTAQLARGVEIGPQSPMAGEVAKMLCEMAGMERATFCNTGSEAVMAAVRVARTVTGRSKIVYFTGDYHGTFDEVLGRANPADPGSAVPVAPGIPPGMLGEVLLLEYGARESLEKIAQIAGTLAAVLVEPVQSRRPELQPVEFLRAVRRITEDAGAALIFDEVITGFRCHPGGAQALFGVRADLATFGKIIGGGMPIGAVCGSAKYMDAFDGGMWQYGDSSFPEVGVTFFAGTFVRHPLALAAAKAVLTYLKEQGARLQTELNARTAGMVFRINAAFDAVGAPLRLNHFASLFSLSYPHDIKYGSLIYFYLRAAGIHIWEGRPCFLSTAHTDADVERIVDAYAYAVRMMQEGGFLPSAPVKTPGEPVKTPGEPVKTSNEFGALDNGKTASAVSDINEPALGEQGSYLSPFRGDAESARQRAMEGRGVPTTASQREVWVTCQMGEGASCALNESFTLRMRGAFDVDILRRAMMTVTDRHEALRTTFSPDGEYQTVQPSINCDITVHDLSGFETSERRRKVGELLEAEGRTPFDLTNGPLVRSRIVRLAPNYHLVMVTAHHIVCDGWSAAILLEELGAAYSAFARRSPLSLPESKRFTEFAQEQTSDEFLLRSLEARRYWLSRLADISETVTLPADRPRRPNHQFEGARLTTAIPGQLVERIRKLGSANQCTLYTTFLAAYSAFLYRLTGQSQLLIGVPSAGQTNPNYDRLVGHCVSLLPLRVDVRADVPFTDHLAAVKRAVSDAQDHTECTIGSLAQEALAGRESLAGPVIFVTFNLEKQMSAPEFGPLSVEVDVNPRSYSQFELGLNLVDVGNSIQLECDYRCDLFDETTIQSWMSHFIQLLMSAVGKPETDLASLEIMSAAERDQILNEFSGSVNDYGREKSMADFFAEQVAARPNAIALEQGERKLTYAELDGKASNLALALLDHGVSSGSRVGICLGRSMERIVAMLGIIKAGAGFVPIDPAYPNERIAYMVSDSGCLVTVTTSSQAGRFAQMGVEHLAVEDVPPAGTRPLPPCPATGASLASVMYTSGSTGNPKGALVTQRGIARMVKKPSYIEIGPDDTMLHVAPYTFDGSSFEIWSALLNGARLVVMPQDTPTLREIGEVVQSAKVTTLLLTSGLFHGMVDHELASMSGLRNLLSGGDVLSPNHVRTVIEALPNCRMINVYGPTENACFTCCHTAREEDADGRAIPIGPPIANTRVYILDRNLHPVPVGFAGELYAAGDGLAMGYTGSDGMERFVANPFAPVLDFSVNGEGDWAHTHMYATGDRARWREDGIVEFLGRVDTQVKIRGHRVELGEIENALIEHEGVEQALVVVDDRGGDDKRLVAYYVAADPHAPPARILATSPKEGKVEIPELAQGRTLSPSSPLGEAPSLRGGGAGERMAGVGNEAEMAEDLREFLAARLPAYMTPSRYVRLDSIPLTRNGKPDRKALPGPEDETEATSGLEPSDPVDRALGEIWRDLLGVRGIGLDDDFFALGGHSLLAIRLCARVESGLGVRIPVAALLEYSTLRSLGRLIRRLQTPHHAAQAAPSCLTPIKATGSRPPLFCVHHVDGVAICYRDLAEYLPAEQPVIGIESRSVNTEIVPLQRIEDIAAEYLAEVTAVQPDGPYLLCGLSFGGVVAFEMARQLSRMGKQVGFLGLIDTYGPEYYRSPANAETQQRPIILRAIEQFQTFSALEVNGKLGYVKSKARGALRRLRKIMPGGTAEDAELANGFFAERLRTVKEANLQALADYRPGPYSGCVTLLRATERLDRDFNDPLLAWGGLATGGIEVRDVLGNHYTIIQHPFVKKLAREIDACLNEVFKEDVSVR